MPMVYCSRCGFRTDLARIESLSHCPSCGGLLKIEHGRTWNPRGHGLARYSSMLALTPLRSLGEGSTPLVEIDKGCFAKLEYLNPTGSFKDRGAALAINHAYRVGKRCVVEDTSGNTGISVVAYAKIYGLEAYISMPRDAPEGKKRLIRMLGGSIVEAPDRGKATEIAIEMHRGYGCYYVAHLSNPLFIEGYRTIAYEIFEQLGVPDYVIVPVGSGGLLLGIYEGFKDLVELGIAKRIPKLIAVQGVEVAPLHKALYGEVGLRGTSRLADGIRVPKPPLLPRLVEAVKKSCGKVILVNDNDIVDALRDLVSMGFVVEPTSATVYAAYKKIAQEVRGHDVVLVLTGSGLKILDFIYEILSRQPS